LGAGASAKATARLIGREGYFYELSNPCAHFSKGYHEPAFNSRNFRPVKKTSIEIFKKLLAPSDLENVC
jgi:hypothetical protein